MTEDFQELQGLRDLNNTISHARSLCDGNSDLVDSLLDLSRRNHVPSNSAVPPQSNPTSQSQSLESLAARVKGYAKGFEVLQTSCNALINLVSLPYSHLSFNRKAELTSRPQSSHAMDWKYQRNAETTNEILLRLARNTAEDSATVKTITVLSLVFLPGSFMAVRTQPPPPLTQILHLLFPKHPSSSSLPHPSQISLSILIYSFQGYAFPPSRRRTIADNFCPPSADPLRRQLLRHRRDQLAPRPGRQLLDLHGLVARHVCADRRRVQACASAESREG